MIQAFKAIEHMHDANLVHRDIKVSFASFTALVPSLIKDNSPRTCF
jgi:serine/threonine protein kinase